MYTVVICTHNRSALLAQTLTSLTRLELPAGLSWQVLVVDNASNDVTAAVVRDFASCLPIHYVFEPRPGKSFALNTALHVVRDGIILFTDDDVVVSPRWLAAADACARRYPLAHAFGGPVRALFAAPPRPELLNAFPLLASGFCGLDPAIGEGPLPEQLFPVGANMAVRRAEIGALRFDPAIGPGRTIGGEETQFVQHIRASAGQIVWSPEMAVEHYVPADRSTLRYTLWYLEQNGRATVTTRGVPAGRRVVGVPRWLVGSCIRSYAAYVGYRLSRQRIQALCALGTHVRLRGMIRQCFATRKQHVGLEVAYPWT